MASDALLVHLNFRNSGTDVNLRRTSSNICFRGADVRGRIEVHVEQLGYRRIVVPGNGPMAFLRPNPEAEKQAFGMGGGGGGGLELFENSQEILTTAVPKIGRKLCGWGPWVGARD